VIVQVPPVTVAVAVTGRLIPFSKVTVTVWPSSTPVTVPETVTAASSDALTMSSMAIGVAIATVAAVSMVTLKAADVGEAFPAASVATAV